MHNRARMVAASFLVKDLGIDWREGARHFFDLLLDGDVAQNVGNWQWVAGTGVDTRPNRVYNPTAQLRKLDPEGAYVRRYVPGARGRPAPGARRARPAAPATRRRSWTTTRPSKVPGTARLVSLCVDERAGARGRTASGAPSRRSCARADLSSLLGCAHGLPFGDQISMLALPLVGRPLARCECGPDGVPRPPSGSRRRCCSPFMREPGSTGAAGAARR